MEFLEQRIYVLRATDDLFGFDQRKSLFKTYHPHRQFESKIVHSNVVLNLQYWHSLNGSQLILLSSFCLFRKAGIRGSEVQP